MTNDHIKILNNMLKIAKEQEFENVRIKTIELELLLEAATKAPKVRLATDPGLEQIKCYIRSCIINAYNIGWCDGSIHEPEAIINLVTKQCNAIFLK